MTYSNQLTECFPDFAAGLYAYAQIILELLVGFYTVEVCELTC
jgi:hypothetical protein